jgi:hypothetical protein
MKMLPLARNGERIKILLFDFEKRGAPVLI